jgi:UPF0716 protein FxsA
VGKRVAVLLLVGLPVAELYTIVKVAHLIGPLATILLLILGSSLGARLGRRARAQALVALLEALAAGRTPTRELADGAVVVIGAALLLIPGFLTDIVGLFFLFPPTRPIARRGLLRVCGRLAARGGLPPMAFGFPGNPSRPPGRPDGRVIRGETDEGEDRRS